MLSFLILLSTLFLPSFALCGSVAKGKLSQKDRWLHAHNYYRCRHGRELLRWDSNLAKGAQSWSNRGQMKHSSGNYGENLAGGRRSIEASVTAWYNEVVNPGYKPGSDWTPGVGHYTALIWKSTTKLGCGHYVGSKSSWGQLDTCRYKDSIPNMMGQFVANVPQKNKPTVSASVCCSRVYGGKSTPVDGGWSEWGAYGACAGTGTCTKKRTRTCTNPRRSAGGKACPGSAQQSTSCTCPVAPVDGGWSPWTGWEPCSTNCGGGQRSRSRTCTNPAPNGAGAPCETVPIGASQSEACNTAACVADPPAGGGDNEPAPPVTPVDPTQDNPGECRPLGPEKAWRLWGIEPCKSVQDTWGVCTNEGDVNFAEVMQNCPVTCALARGDNCPHAVSGGGSNPNNGDGTTDVDCAGTWSACDADCMKTFSITTTQSGAGAACPTSPAQCDDSCTVQSTCTAPVVAQQIGNPACMETPEETAWRMWGIQPCSYMQDTYGVCTNPDDVNYDEVSENCPATCGRAKGDCPEIQAQTGICEDKASWDDVKETCSGCRVLANNMKVYETCTAYCTSQGLQCTGSWEEIRNGCSVDSTHTCDYNYNTEMDTDDALCECTSIQTSSVPDVNCAGTWSTCSAACKETYTVNTECSGQGTPCPAIRERQCNPGEGLCPLDSCLTGPNGQPCLNGGIPTGTTGTCGCDCMEGYLGANCETVAPADDCLPSAEELAWRLEGEESCREIEDTWGVCSDDSDSNYARVMAACPATCRQAHGECGTDEDEEDIPDDANPFKKLENTNCGGTGKGEKILCSTVGAGVGECSSSNGWIMDVPSCELLCAGLPQCDGFVYAREEGTCFLRTNTDVKQNADLSRDCYLKPQNGIAFRLIRKMNCGGTVDGEKIPCKDAPEDGVAVGPTSIECTASEGWVLSVPACEQFCRDLGEDCDGFTYVNAEGACYLRTNAATVQSPNTARNCYIKPTAASACAVTAPSNGALGGCPESLASGSSCAAACNLGYRREGVTTCIDGVLTAATCEEGERTFKGFTISQRVTAPTKPTVTGDFTLPHLLDLEDYKKFEAIAEIKSVTKSAISATALVGRDAIVVDIDVDTGRVTWQVSTDESTDAAAMSERMSKEFIGEAEARFEASGNPDVSDGALSIADLNVEGPHSDDPNAGNDDVDPNILDDVMDNWIYIAIGAGLLAVFGLMFWCGRRSRKPRHSFGQYRA